MKQNYDKLASCSWGLATAHGVVILTELCVIYVERYASHAKYRAHRPNS